MREILSPITVAKKESFIEMQDRSVRVVHLLPEEILPLHDTSEKTRVRLAKACMVKSGLGKDDASLSIGIEGLHRSRTRMEQCPPAEYFFLDLGEEATEEILHHLSRRHITAAWEYAFATRYKSLMQTSETQLGKNDYLAYGETIQRMNCVQRKYRYVMHEICGVE